MRRHVLAFWFLASIVLAGGLWAQNAYYDHGTYPQPGSTGSSAAMRAELDLIEAGFAKLPTLSGNASKAVVINGSGTGMTTTTGTLTLPGNLALVGANNVTMTTTAPTTLTLPTTGTLLTGSSPVISGTVTGTYALGGTPTVSSLLTLSSGQLAFPSTQSSSANVNTLDDYEEGTWTPTVGGSATYSTQLGTYTKIGRVVFIVFFMQITTLGTGSNNTVSGLPFTNVGHDTGISMGLYHSLPSNWYSVYGRVNSATSTLGFFGHSGLADGNGFTVTFGNGTYLSGSAFYFAAT
jgi:hypothetical protein